jgi:hypothetical protein
MRQWTSLHYPLIELSPQNEILVYLAPQTPICKREALLLAHQCQEPPRLHNLHCNQN